MKECISLMIIPMFQNRSSDDDVDDVCILGGVARDGKEMLVGNVSPMSPQAGMWRHDKWSAFEFSLPFLSLISKSNS